VRLRTVHLLQFEGRYSPICLPAQHRRDCLCMEERKMATNTLPANVSVSEATELTKNGARIIDVRTPSEFESVHIPGSYNVPLDQLSEHRRELTQALDSPALLVCGSGMRARQADNTLREAGLQSLTVLEGGITAWENSGEPVVRGAQRPVRSRACCAGTPARCRRARRPSCRAAATSRRHGRSPGSPA
jgi:rhodanese-related sulfurtransferase